MSTTILPIHSDERGVFKRCPIGLLLSRLVGDDVFESVHSTYKRDSFVHLPFT
ncbi:hypothetical protein PILCRDRAFT_810637 [Piloderma croceum F 1598]|uniref:Uncharacterized protein n=1 Tax=Piloderma croceum (strain F 1598) TaxID=765440 RepID=A0A0C3GI87_PILCF|nr:hypothetical protein PILCRDRAFT_810637 [Piloderma croceum F 1598]